MVLRTNSWHPSETSDNIDGIEDICPYTSGTSDGIED